MDLTLNRDFVLDSSVLIGARRILRFIRERKAERNAMLKAALKSSQKPLKMSTQSNDLQAIKSPENDRERLDPRASSQEERSRQPPNNLSQPVMDLKLKSVLKARRNRLKAAIRIGTACEQTRQRSHLHTEEDDAV